MIKKTNKKGFTLAELLVVVAIIAVLVAVSIPIFTAQLRKARLATNQANARAAKAEAVANYLTATGVTDTTTYTLVYTVSSGTGVTGTALTTVIKDADGTASTAIEDWDVEYTNTAKKLGDVTFSTWSVTVGKDGVTAFGAN